MFKQANVARHSWFVVNLILMLALFLSACSGGAAPAPAPADSKPAATEPAAAQPATEQPAAAQPATDQPAADAGSAYNESPILTAKVTAGELPPVEERLPKEPYVVSKDKLVVDFDLQIGKYGGVMRLPADSPTGDPHVYIGMNEPLIWAPGAFEYDKGIEGNIAKDWEANDDYSVFTIHLREGLKWSDGALVTTEDVRFSYEDVLLNEEITPVFPLWLRTANYGEGSPMKIEIVDDLTFKIVFDGPYGSFPAQLAIAGWHSYAELLRPKHYLSQFHIKYTPLEKLKPLMEAESIPEDQWFNLFNDRQLGPNLWKLTNEGGIGHPTLTAWMMTKAESGVFTFERNPYYFKVDEAGNQLPYMDGLRTEVVQDRETMFARAVMGEFDYLGERSSLKNLPLMAAAEKKGIVKVLLPRMHRTPLDFKLNLSLDDPDWQSVVGDVRFRRALDYAINRPEILKTFFLDQFAKLPSQTANAEYSQEKANQLLDEMGMNKRDADGYRLSPSGKPFSILLEIGSLSQDHVPMGELITEYWKDVGVNASIKAGEWSLISERVNANEVQGTGVWAHVDIWPSGGWDDYLPNNQWAVSWNNWYASKGENGLEPPQGVKDLFALHEAFMVAKIGSPESTQAMNGIFKNHIDNVWVFTPVEKSHYPTFVTTRIQNVPTGIVDTLGIVIMYSMEQWFIEE